MCVSHECMSESNVRGWGKWARRMIDDWARGSWDNWSRSRLEITCCVPGKTSIVIGILARIPYAVYQCLCYITQCVDHAHFQWNNHFIGELCFRGRPKNILCFPRISASIFFFFFFKINFCALRGSSASIY